MTAAEARRLIGKQVSWVEHVGGLGTRAYEVKRSGVFREVRGKNVCVDFDGSNDWLWLPDIRGMVTVGDKP